MLLVKSSRVFEKKIEDKLYLLKEGEDYFRELNEVASFIWQELAKPVSLEELVARVAKNFKAEKATIKKDTMKFLKEYVKNGLVEEVSDRTEAQ